MTAFARVIIAPSLMTDVVAAQSAANIVKGIQDRWMRCLKVSFQINSEKTLDKSAAAEMAFRACATEEDESRAYSEANGVPRSSFAHLKAAMKQVLIEGK